MVKQISGANFQLIKIFSRDFEYYIPPYQRPYAWTKGNTTTLFDDLYNFYSSEKNDEHYYLGSIVLIKDEGNAHSEVIDGQQRLTTLTILLACMAVQFKENSNLRLGYFAVIQELGNAASGTEPHPRLHLRDKDAQFFEKYVQNLDIDGLLSVSKNELGGDEAREHIQENAAELLKLIQTTFNGDENKLKDFGLFLLNRCDMVVVSTPSRDSAFRIFSVMNSRGLNLLPIDILKADILGKLSENPKKCDEYTSKWDELEEIVSRDGLNEVITHTRTIFSKDKQEKSLLEEFKTYVIKENKHDEVPPDKLIDEIIEPYCKAFATIKRQDYECNDEKKEKEINKYLRWLCEYDHADWTPVAMKSLLMFQNKEDILGKILKKLERLAGFCNATGKSTTSRIHRYSKILVDLEAIPSKSIDIHLPSLELSEDEKTEFLSTLDGDIYSITSNRRLCVLLRLDNFMSEGDLVHVDKPTIEHVLPQKVEEDSEWAKTWPDVEVRKAWLHRIGNLVLLTRNQNSKAQNYDFSKKKEKYFKGKTSAPYPITTRVLEENEWTPEVVERLQKRHLECFKEHWEL